MIEKLPSHLIYGYAAANQSGQEKFSVLLVEDAPLIQKFSMDVLEMLGCEVTLANNAAEAIRLGKGHYDLIFMDIGLPDDSGINVICELRKSHHQHTPIIAITAQATDEIRQACFDAGVNDFLAKPASYTILLKCVSKYTARRATLSS